MGLLKEEKKSWGSGGLFGNRAFFSLVLILLCPLFALTFWYTCKEHKGSFIDMFKKVSELVKSSDFKGINDLWPNQFNPLAWKIISGYMLFEILLMKFGKINQKCHKKRFGFLKINIVDYHQSKSII